MPKSKAARTLLSSIFLLIGGAFAAVHARGIELTGAKAALPLELSSGTYVRPGGSLILRSRGNGIFTFIWIATGSTEKACSVRGFVDSLSGSGKPDSDPGCKITVEATVGGVVLGAKRLQCQSLCSGTALSGSYARDPGKLAAE